MGAKPQTSVTVLTLYYIDTLCVFDHCICYIINFNISKKSILSPTWMRHLLTSLAQSALLQPQWHRDPCQEHQNGESKHNNREWLLRFQRQSVTPRKAKQTKKQKILIQKYKYYKSKYKNKKQISKPRLFVCVRTSEWSFIKIILNKRLLTHSKKVTILYSNILLAIFKCIEFWNSSDYPEMVTVKVKANK